MSNVTTITDTFAHTSTTGWKIVMSYQAASHHCASVFFDLTVKGSGAVSQSEFAVFACDSFTGGTSTPLTQNKVDATDPETPQGTWLTWDPSVQPTPTGAVRVDQAVLANQTSAPTRVRKVRGGKIIYIATKNATASTPVDITGNCNQ